MTKLPNDRKLQVYLSHWLFHNLLCILCAYTHFLDSPGYLIFRSLHFGYQKKLLWHFKFLPQYSGECAFKSYNTLKNNDLKGQCG